ncbi:MAG: hypothetical protein ABI776_14030 [Nocardioidaceae bacterium]
MPDPDPTEPTSASRPLVPLAPAVKACLLVTALLLVLGAYFLVVPLHVNSSSGSPFECSRAVSWPSGAFAQNSCGRINEVYLMRAVGVFIAAVLVGGGGFLLFGARRKAPAPATTA